jgi:M6 family metalloprotease-like protein
MSTCKRYVEILFVILFLTAAYSSVPTTSAVFGASYNYQVLSGKHTVSGVQRALIILVEFQDARHTQSPSQIRNIALDQLNSYYTEVSRGKVSITGDVYGWYTVNHSISYYGHDNKNPGDDNNIQALARDALSLMPASADLTPFNFLVIVHAGQDQAADKSDVPSDEIWSVCFCSVFPNYESFKPISGNSKSFENYAFLSEFNGMGTFAHEWGHFFGLPDLYDADSNDNYVGYWSLMDAGNWCCLNEDQATPSDIGAWGDALLGWLTPSIAETSLVVSSFPLNPLESSNPAAILIPVSPSTYYFIEYRNATGIDSHLPGSGILIYYVDETLDSGQGILRLENPKTGKLYPAQHFTRNLNGATFQNGDQFRDPAHQVYVAFLGGKESFAMLYSKQELTGAILRSNLRTSSIPFTATYGEQISLSGTLVGENGTPLTGQTVEVDILDPASNQWQTIGSTMTGQQGEISLQVRLSVRIGDYRFRLLYPGGKIGSTWYSSSSADFLMSITPAIMKIAVSFPKIIAPDRISVEVSATTSNGEPLPGVTFEIYVDNVRRGIVQTDASGKATLALSFGFGDMGSHAITAKAFTENYLPANSTDSVLIIPPLWLIGIVAAAVLAVIAFRVVKRRSGSRQTELEGSAVLCPSCGAELPPDSSFCLKCGTSIPPSP